MVTEIGRAETVDRAAYLYDLIQATQRVEAKAGRVVPVCEGDLLTLQRKDHLDIALRLLKPNLNAQRATLQVLLENPNSTPPLLVWRAILELQVILYKHFHGRTREGEWQLRWMIWKTYGDFKRVPDAIWDLMLENLMNDHAPSILEALRFFSSRTDWPNRLIPALDERLTKIANGDLEFLRSPPTQNPHLAGAIELERKIFQDDLEYYGLMKVREALKARRSGGPR